MITVATLTDLTGRRHFIADDAGHRSRRSLAADHEISHRRKRIDIGPRPLSHARRIGILLDGCEPGLENDGREALRYIADDASRSAEVEQQWPAVLEDEDVVR